MNGCSSSRRIRRRVSSIRAFRSSTGQGTAGVSHGADATRSGSMTGPTSSPTASASACTPGGSAGAPPDHRCSRPPPKTAAGGCKGDFRPGRPAGSLRKRPPRRRGCGRFPAGSGQWLLEKIGGHDDFRLSLPLGHDRLDPEEFEGRRWDLRLGGSFDLEPGPQAQLRPRTGPRAQPRPRGARSTSAAARPPTGRPPLPAGPPARPPPRTQSRIGSGSGSASASSAASTAGRASAAA